MKRNKVYKHRGIHWRVIGYVPRTHRCDAFWIVKNLEPIDDVATGARWRLSSLPAAAR